MWDVGLLILFPTKTDIKRSGKCLGELKSTNISVGYSVWQLEDEYAILTPEEPIEWIDESQVQGYLDHITREKVRHAKLNLSEEDD